MIKSTLALAATILAALGASSKQELRSVGRAPADRTLRLKEERMTLEFTPSRAEARLAVQAESETGLARIEVFDPHGRRAFRITNGGAGQELTLQGFNIETHETSASELFDVYPEGRYRVRAWTVDGVRLEGSASFRHELLPGADLLYPYEGAHGVPTNLTIGWSPVAGAAGYHVNLEQNDNDGLSVELPASCNSFRVPEGVLVEGTLTYVEVGTLTQGGNITNVEISFTTR